MNAEELVRRLGLPIEAIVNRKVPKLVLSKWAGVTPKDRRLIKGEVESLDWIAVLKPATVGVRAYATEERDYSELSVLVLKVRSSKQRGHLRELIHRAVPYHTLLLTEAPSRVSLSVANKRRSKSENDRFVVEDEVVWTDFDVARDEVFVEEFAVSMSLQSVAPQNLREIYFSWTDSIVSLEAASITNSFQLSSCPDDAVARATALSDYRTSQREIESIRKTANRETQARRRVELNMALQDLKKKQEQAVRTLNPPEPLTS